MNERLRANITAWRATLAPFLNHHPTCTITSSQRQARTLRAYTSVHLVQVSTLTCNFLLHTFCRHIMSLPTLRTSLVSDMRSHGGGYGSLFAEFHIKFSLKPVTVLSHHFKCVQGHSHVHTMKASESFPLVHHFIPSLIDTQGSVAPSNTLLGQSVNMHRASH